MGIEALDLGDPIGRRIVQQLEHGILRVAIRSLRSID
jgi:hypothetical protein